MCTHLQLLQVRLGTPHKLVHLVNKLGNLAIRQGRVVVPPKVVRLGDFSYSCLSFAQVTLIRLMISVQLTLDLPCGWR